MGIDLSIIWVVIIFFGVFVYVIIDGFDLGVGMLYAFVPERLERDVMMNTVAPVWDGNETWLVLGGAALFAAFPRAYAIILSALYLPLIFMLLGLIFRGIAFEFRFKANDAERHIWDKAFFGGSLAAAFFQGVALGAYVDGIDVVATASGLQYAGGPFSWVAAFPFLCGLGVMVAYLLLGSTWLIYRTDAILQHRMIALARTFTGVLACAILAVSIWTPLADAAVAARWFTWPGMLWFAPVPILVVVGVMLLLRALAGPAPHHGPFMAALGLIFLGYTGLAISIWPNIVPPGVTIWQAASPPSSQAFTLVGTLFILPIILGYSGFSYYIFRGKVKLGEGYH